MPDFPNPPPAAVEPLDKAAPQTDLGNDPDDKKGFWRVFASTFGAIFLAEIGDKTQVATLLMSAESGNPWTVFLGAGTALVATSLIGVALGQWLSRRVSPHTLDTAAGAVLIAITLWLLWDITGS